MMPASLTARTPKSKDVRDDQPKHHALAPSIALVPNIASANLVKTGTSKAGIRQAHSKATILAAARQLIMEQGYDHVPIRQLAERSGVTPPTIYNLLGKREEVLRKAVCEMQAAKLAFAARKAIEDDVNGILIYGDTLWITLADNPEYSRQAIRAIMSLDADLDLQIRESTKKAIRSWLIALEDGGKLRRSVNTGLMAELMHRQILTAVSAWAKNDIGTEDLREQMAISNGLLLLGIVTTKEAERIDAWLSQFGIKSTEERQR